MQKSKLAGAGAAMITPFTADGRVDYKALARMIDYVIEGGVDYIVALGTTAETPTLYMPERAVIAMFITNQIAGRVPLVIGCGGNSTSEVLDQLREFDLRGADAILSVTPYYNKPSQEGLYQHFRTVSEHSPLPVILYNIPGRSGVNMTAETTLRLAREVPNIIGIKEASGNIEQMQRILDNRPEGFLVLSGDDAMTIPLMRRGGDGVISVAANAFPRRFMQCVNLAKQGAFDRAEEAYASLREAVEALFAELAANISKPGATDVLIKEKLADDFELVDIEPPAVGTAIITGPRSLRWSIDSLGTTSSESAVLRFLVRHVDAAEYKIPVAHKFMHVITHSCF